MQMQPNSDILSQDRKILAKLDAKTFLITGGNGMLGRAYQTQLKHLVPTAKVYYLNKAELDVRRIDAFAPYNRVRPDYVVHCAALVDADYCEDHEDEATDSIVAGTNNVLEFTRQCGAKLLYPQSFLIYDGADPLIDEKTMPRPLNVYGRLKLTAEKNALDGSVPALAVRMGGFFGGMSADNNFVGRITPHLAKLIRQGTPSIEIGNRVWQPTYTDDLAANSLLLLATDCVGTYCMASQGSASFHELTIEIARQLGISDKIEINSIDATLFAAKERAKRPLSAIMRNQRLQDEGLDRQRPWQTSLAEYLNQPFFRDIFK